MGNSGSNIISLNFDGSEVRDTDGFTDKEFVLGFLKNTLLRKPQLYKEARILKEIVQLVASKEFGGYQMPRGAGEPIMLIPGFGAADRSMSILSGWLGMLGYNVYPSGLPRNILAPKAALAILQNTLEDANRATNSKVTVIGWSLGGAQAKMLSDRNPDKIEKVIGLAPVFNSDIGTTPLIIPMVIPVGLFNLIRSGPNVIKEQFDLFRELNKPVKVPHVSIYSESDGILLAKTCKRGDSENIEVNSSHVGMPFNKEVYAHLSNLLHRDRPPKLKVV